MKILFNTVLYVHASIHDYKILFSKCFKNEGEGAESLFIVKCNIEFTTKLFAVR